MKVLLAILGAMWVRFRRKRAECTGGGCGVSTAAKPGACDDGACGVDTRKK